MYVSFNYSGHGHGRGARRKATAATVSCTITYLRAKKGKIIMEQQIHWTPVAALPLTL